LPKDAMVEEGIWHVLKGIQSTFCLSFFFLFLLGFTNLFKLFKDKTQHESMHGWLE